MKYSQSVKEIATALAKAQGEIQAAKKQADNPFFKSKYADLDSVKDAIRKPLADNGLSLLQEVQSIFMPTDSSWSLPIFDKDGDLTGARDEGKTSRTSTHALTALLLHTSGEFIEFEAMVIPVEEANNVQKVKAAITYMRRTQILAILCMSEEDDDGNSAVRQQPYNKPAPATAPKTPLKNFAPPAKKTNSAMMSGPPPGFNDGPPDEIPF